MAARVTTDADISASACFEWEVLPARLALIAERCASELVGYISSHALPNAQLLRQLPKLVQTASAVMFAGPAGRRYISKALDIG